MVVALRQGMRAVRCTLMLGMLVALTALTFAASATAATVGGGGGGSAGSFVIGDGNAVKGTSVTFWGAQWGKANSLSGGPAPAAFKGFANALETPPACGTNWSTDPGNSSGPPPGPLPEFIKVIVSSHIVKSGATISGDTKEVVLVETGSGYAANPGHAGTGTIVGVVCDSSGGGNPT
jgi:hypothetical protein